MKNLNNTEIKAIGCGDLSCPKTTLSVASSICSATGISIQTFAVSWHLSLNMTDPTTPKSQRIVAICINVAGLCLNIASAALSMISSAASNCANPATITNTTVAK